MEWSAHQAGIELPDGSWNQYRTLHEQGASISVDDALKTKGALVFGFSSDPLASPDRPARAYVGISLGNGKVLDVSERARRGARARPGQLLHARGAHPRADRRHSRRVRDIPRYDMLHPSSPLQRDSDGDGMLDVDERVLERDPFDPSDGTETTTSPRDDGMPQDGPITSPRQVDPTLSKTESDSTTNPSDDAVMGGMRDTTADATAQSVDDTAATTDATGANDASPMDERVVLTGDEPPLTDADMQMIDDTVNTFLPPADDCAHRRLGAHQRQRRPGR